LLTNVLTYVNKSEFYYKVLPRHLIGLRRASNPKQSKTKEKNIFYDLSKVAKLWQKQCVLPA